MRLYRLKDPREIGDDWHTWFAWYPITTINNTTVWLEFVERRVWGTRGGEDVFSYRFPQGDTK